MGINYDALRLQSVMIDGVYYRVEDYPHRKDVDIGPYTLKKGIAYRYVTDITKGLFPYRGIMDEHFSWKKSPVGLYLRKRRHDRHEVVVVRPRTAKEAAEHKLGREIDTVAAVLGNQYRPDQFMDNSLTSSDVGTEVYLPQIRAGDDFLNKMIKLFIRKKEAPLEPYGRRMEAMAVDKSRGSVERSNSRNNYIRAIRTNSSCSPGMFEKFLYFWEGECALILRDKPGAMHPMGIPEGKMLVLFPDGVPFEINQEDLLNASPMISEAVAASTEEERIMEIKKKCPKGHGGRKKKPKEKEVEE